MDKLIIHGPCKLHSEVQISAAKNATLPLLCATLLVNGKTTFSNLPKLMDVKTTFELLENLGVQIDNNCIDTSNITSYFAPYDLVRKMRASILVLGPLLARFGEAKVSLPGGCAIGTRPIDIHLDGLKLMGAKIELEEGYVKAKAKKLMGAKIPLKFPSVGATENLMMAAALAQGESLIENAAAEPEIVDLAKFLIQRGVEISGAGTPTIRIQGVRELKNNTTPYEIISDRIEAITYLIAALMTNSEIKILSAQYKNFESVILLLQDIGAQFELDENTIIVKKHNHLKPLNFSSEPYPGIPTDAQAQLMALATTIKGESTITESIFENRFMHVPEMVRMGANISLNGNTATITGGKSLKGAPVMCTDLRASAALVLTALVSEGETTIRRIYHLDRGYENLDKKFQALGAKMERVNE